MKKEKLRTRQEQEAGAKRLLLIRIRLGWKKIISGRNFVSLVLEKKKKRREDNI